MADLLAHLAPQAEQRLNVSKAAEAVGVRRPTGEGHRRLLENVLLVVRIILTTGRRSYTSADRRHAMPIDRLWTPVQN